MTLAVSTAAWGALLGIAYVVLLVTLGITAIRKGHWIMFLVGIVLPIFWLIGALLPPKHRTAGRGAAY